MFVYLARVEKYHKILGFSDKLVPIAIKPTTKLDDAVKEIEKVFPHTHSPKVTPMLFRYEWVVQTVHYQ